MSHPIVCLQHIQVTATTPTGNAVRLETEQIQLELSNRVLCVGRKGDEVSANQKLKVFVRVTVNLELSLGTLQKNLMYEEVEPDFPTLATFKTKINLRNALQVGNEEEEEEEEEKRRGGE